MFCTYTQITFDQFGPDGSVPFLYWRPFDSRYNISPNFLDFLNTYPIKELIQYFHLTFILTVVRLVSL